MLFPTVEFAVFFSVVLALSWSVPLHGTRWKVLLLGASYFFYGWWDWRFVLLIIGSTVVNHAAALAIDAAPDRRSARPALAAAVAANLAVLGFFKYYGFFVGSVAGALGGVGLSLPLPLLQVVLPVGISFFTFQAISYAVDIHRGTVEPAPLLDFAVYLAFFPHVVAGPIVRASEFMPQLRRREEGAEIEAGRAVLLIVAGLVKKVVLASLLATSLVDPVFAAPAAHSGLEVLVAAYGYAVQIWADFSGYTDIAIGCALLLGIRFPDNFHSPYTARSLRDFWRRWHMTLSRWLRDYLYIPLGGSRRGTVLTYRNVMLTMLLGGLWHGAAWTFVIWGGIHGAGVSVERWWRGRRAGGGGTPASGGVGSWLLTFHVVCLAWLFFRADSLGTAWQLLGRLPDIAGPASLLTPAVLLAIAAGVGSQFISRDLLAAWQESFARLRPAVQGSLLAASLVAVGAFGPSGVAPFIYYRF